MKRGTIITILAIVLFGALLLFNTLSAQKVECTICVEYNGKRNGYKGFFLRDDFLNNAG